MSSSFEILALLDGIQVPHVETLPPDEVVSIVVLICETLRVNVSLGTDQPGIHSDQMSAEDEELFHMIHNIVNRRFSAQYE